MKKIKLKCHRCGLPIEDVGFAMLFWETDGYKGPVVRWAIAHKNIRDDRYDGPRCDPGFNLSVELYWLVSPNWDRKGPQYDMLGEPTKIAQVHRVLLGYDWPAADALALCALFQVPPPAEFAATGRTG